MFLVKNNYFAEH